MVAGWPATGQREHGTVKQYADFAAWQEGLLCRDVLAPLRDAHEPARRRMARRALAAANSASSVAGCGRGLHFRADSRQAS